MKKILSLLMLLCMAAYLAASVVGCGHSSSTPSGVDQADEEVLTEEDEAGEEAIGQ